MCHCYNINVHKSVKVAIPHVVLILIALAVMVGFGVMISYRIIIVRIIKLSTQNMTELVAHDARSTESFIQTKWLILESIASNLSSQNCKTTQELQSNLAMYIPFMNCIMLTLVSPNNMTASSNFVIKKDKPMAELCREGGDRFVKRIISPRALTQGKTAELIYGVRIKGLAVDNVTYTYIVARLDIDTIQDMMRTDCYNGAGQSYIINKDGFYIVKDDRSHTPQLVDNFFQILKSGEIENDWDIKRVRRSITNHESFSFMWLNPTSEPHIISVTPMRYTEWYFIIRVPMSVFIAQSKELLSVVIIFIIVAIVIIASAVFIVLRKTYQMIAQEHEYHKTLTIALNKADAASRAKTAFLNSMSHDIRTPMNAIIGYTALAAKHLNNTLSVTNYLDKIAQSSDYLLALINDVLDMSRIEAGKVHLNSKPESLIDILDGIQNIVQADIHARDIKFIIDKSLITNENVVCDRLHFNQVLLNLISNAMKFTKAGGSITLAIKERTSKSLDKAIYDFSVSDTGIGMSDEFQKIIFEPFTREQTATVSGIQGTGLGMSITKNLVDMMGGTISLKSKVGVGTTFIVTVELPLVIRNDEHSFTNTKVAESKELKEDFDFHGLSLLLVEDNEFNREIAFEILTEAGFVVNTACNGQEAVDVLKNAPYDQYAAVLMDIQMPIMDGYAATKIIRGLGISIPIIALTANAFEEDKKTALDAGMNAHIEKPINIGSLLKTLRSLLTK